MYDIYIYIFCKYYFTYSLVWKQFEIIFTGTYLNSPNCHLIELNLSKNSIEDAGALSIAVALQNNTVSNTVSRGIITIYYNILLFITMIECTYNISKYICDNISFIRIYIYIIDIKTFIIKQQWD